MKYKEPIERWLDLPSPRPERIEFNKQDALFYLEKFKNWPQDHPLIVNLKNASVD